jgi:hypothetical protein
MWTRDDYRRRGKWGYIVLASLVMAPVVYGLSESWGAVIAFEAMIVATGFAVDHGLRRLK